jgi:hypothetical protein
VYALCLEQASEPAYFNVDHAGAAEIQRLAGILGRVNTLIQADRRFKFTLKLGVVDDVVVRQGLLDHEQVELIQITQRIYVTQCVGRVRVGHQWHIGEAPADDCDHINVVAGCDFELDPAVSFFQVTLYQTYQLAGVALDTQADAGEDLAAGASKGPVEGDVMSLGKQIPSSHLHAGFGKVVAFDALVAGYELVDCLPFSADDRGSEEILEDMPTGFGCLWAVIWINGAGGFSPANDTVRVRLDQNVAKMRAGTGAGHEWPDEWQLYDYYVDAVDLQVLGSRSRT